MLVFIFLEVFAMIKLNICINDTIMICIFFFSDKNSTAIFYGKSRKNAHLALLDLFKDCMVMSKLIFILTSASC